MRSLAAIVFAIFSIAGSLLATDFPTVKAVLPDISTGQDSAIPSIDLRNFFEVTDIHGQVVQMRTTSGSFNIEMLPAAAPLSVTNFLNYVNGGRYATSFVHRSDLGLGVIQGGGYYIKTVDPLALDRIATDPPIALEYNLPNVRGTIAMARTAVLDSATSEWFVNIHDNTTTLGQSNGGGYAVFGRVTGTGMTVVDAIHALPVFNAGSPFNQLPLAGYSGPPTPVVAANFVGVNAAEAVAIFPATAGQNSVVSFSVANTNAALVTAAVSGSSLNLTLVPGASGIADLTVTATDTNGNAVQSAFRLSVTALPSEIVVEQPVGTDLPDGGSRNFPSVNVGSAATATFTIKNTGAGSLALTGTPRVTVDGPDAGMFAVIAQPAATVAPSGSTSFTMRFAPTSSGTKTVAFHIANNDTDESPFDINFTSSGNALPTLTLPTSPVIVEPTSASGAAVTFSVTANDTEDGPLTPVVTPPSGSTFGMGDTTVNVSATDSNGAVTTGSFTVRVTFVRPTSRILNLGAASGNPAPSAGTGALPAGTVLSAFGPPAISDFRKMAARVTMLAGRTALSGIYIEDGAGAQSLPVYQGGPAPGISTAGVTFKRFLDPVIAPGGSVAFVATLQGTTLRTTEDFGVWTDAFGAMQMVLREGAQVPGLPAGSRLQTITSISLRDSELLALLTLRPATGVVTTLTDSVLLRMTSAGTGTVLLREGRELTGLPGSRIMSFSALSPAAASAGHGRWHAEDMTVAKVTLYDGRTVVVKIAPNGIATPILFTASAATQVQAQARWIALGLPALGSEGDGFGVLGTLRQGLGGVVPGNDTALLFSPDGAAWSVFAREGSPAPVTPPGPRYATLLDPLMNDAGETAFIASLQGTGVTTRNRVAIFAGLPGSQTAIARLGSHPPGEAVAEWTRFISLALPSGAGAGAVFLAETTGGGIGIWAVDSTGTLRRLLRTTDTLTVGGSPITSLTLLGAVPGAYGTTRSFNATGSIALLATLADRTQTILRVDIP